MYTIVGVLSFCYNVPEQDTVQFKLHNILYSHYVNATKQKYTIFMNVIEYKISLYIDLWCEPRIASLPLPR